MVTYAQTESSTDQSSAPTALPALKLTCKQGDLARALSIVSHGVLEHSTIPILKNILVATDQGRLRVSATTLDLGIQCWIDAQIEQEGTTALPASLFARMVSALPSEKMTLSIKEGSQTLGVQCAGSFTNIRGCDPREFPIIPGIEGIAPVIIDAALLKSMIGQVAFAASADISKPVMTAVLLLIGRDRLTLAAADEFRLAERVAQLAGEHEPQAPVLIPAKNLLELARILPTSGSVQVMITPSHNQAIFALRQGEQIDVVFRLIEGKFPNYQRVIPASSTTRAVLDTKAFAAALGRAALFAIDSKKSARITVKGPGDGVLFGRLIIEADDADLGNHVDVVAAEVTGPDQQIIFHAKYLAEALEHLDTPQVSFALIGQGRPCLLRPLSEVAYTSLLQSMSIGKTA